MRSKDKIVLTILGAIIGYSVNQSMGAIVGAVLAYIFADNLLQKTRRFL